MKAIILAAGKGERLQPFTKDIPKSLLRIDDQTILENQINHLKKCDIEEINVVVGFAYQKVEQFLKTHYCGNGNTSLFTHTRIGSHEKRIKGGSYTIQQSEMSDFWNIYYIAKHYVDFL